MWNLFRKIIRLKLRAIVQQLFSSNTNDICCCWWYGVVMFFCCLQKNFQTQKFNRFIERNVQDTKRKRTPCSDIK